MLLREAKEILKKNGYRVELDEGLFQAIKDRWNDRKINKDIEKTKKIVKSEKNKYSDTRNDDQYSDESMEKMFNAIKNGLKKYRGIKVKNYEQIDEMWDESFGKLFSTLIPTYFTVNQLKKIIDDKWKGKQATDCLRELSKLCLKHDGFSSLEDAASKYFEELKTKSDEKMKKHLKKIDDDDEDTKWHQTESYRRKYRKLI